ncbi:MAG: DUF2812 domain-containing protein [Oscillospiraceae bacterium]|nr:DUF2812 domain-containing protein [Oscillospiraceae bacterium]
MRKTKRVFAQFTFFDRTGIQAFLEKQAQKGWILEKISSYGWKFRRTEPQKIHFSVTYFPEASIFDPVPGENQKSFWELCEHTGWKLASNNAQMQIFYNETENPVPIETDPQTELETIDKSAKKSYLPSFYILTACGVLQLLLQLWQFSTDPLDWLSRNSSLFSVLCWSIMLAMCLIEILGYFNWRKKARKAIEETNSFIETKGYRKIEIALMWFVLAVFVIFLLSIEPRFALVAAISSVVVGIMSMAVWAFSNLLKKFKVSATANKIATGITIIVMAFGVTGVLLFTVINKAMDAGWFDREVAYTYEYKGMEWKVYDDEIPLRIEDMTETDYDGYSTSWYGDESLFMSKHDAYQSPRMYDLEQPDLQYTFVKVKAPFLYNFAHRQMLKEFPRNFGVTEDEWEFYEHAVEISASEWGARYAYQNYTGDTPNNEYLLCYDDIIIRLRPDHTIEMTSEAKAAIGKKLGNMVICN